MSLTKVCLVERFILIQIFFSQDYKEAQTSYHKKTRSILKAGLALNVIEYLNLNNYSSDQTWQTFQRQR